MGQVHYWILHMEKFKIHNIPGLTTYPVMSIGRSWWLPPSEARKWLKRCRHASTPRGGGLCGLGGLAQDRMCVSPVFISAPLPRHLQQVLRARLAWNTALGYSWLSPFRASSSSSLASKLRVPINVVRLRNATLGLNSSANHAVATVSLATVTSNVDLCNPLLSATF